MDASAEIAVAAAVGIVDDGATKIENEAEVFSTNNAPGPAASEGMVDNIVADPSEETTNESTAENAEDVDSIKLFVGQVPRHYVENDLIPTFAAYGNITEVYIMRQGGLSKGCAFVKVASKEQADATIEALHNKYTLPGSNLPLQVRFASGELKRLGLEALESEEVKLFVGNVPCEASQQDVFAVFESFGEITEVFIMRHRDTGASKGCAFVRFKEQDAADRAVQALNATFTMPGGTNPLKVEAAQSRSKTRTYNSGHRESGGEDHRGNRGGGYRGGHDGYKLFVSGVPEGAGEAHLLQIFSYYGTVQEVVILRDASGYSKCSGFVKYSTQNEAEMAMTALNERYTMPGGTRMLSVRYANSHRGGGGGGHYGGRSAEPRPGPEGDYKLFVGCLPYSSGEQDLHNLFCQHGMVKEVFIMRDNQGESKGSAFVKFGSRAECDVAIQALNGSTLLDASRPIKVSYAISSGGGGNRRSRHQHQQQQQQHHMQMGMAPGWVAQQQQQQYANMYAAQSSQGHPQQWGQVMPQMQAWQQPQY